MSRAYDVVKKARSKYRVRSKEIIEEIFNNIIFLHGDRNYGDSKTIIGGIAEFNNIAISFIGIQKGAEIEEAIETDFGMPKPEAYRKAIRLMDQAEKFQRPLVTIVDTPGAYPGIDAEKRGQFQAIASCIEKMSSLTIPVINFIIGEGGSGGALALSVANKVYMFENSIYSILSPEGFASILWKDSNLADKAAEIMKLTAKELYEYEIIDGIISENNNQPNYNDLINVLNNDLKRFASMSGLEIRQERYNKFRKIGR